MCSEKSFEASGRRPLVDHLRDQYRASERHACRVLLMVRGTYRYQSHQEPWTELRMRIREIAQSRVRYGYRKIRVLLNREGWAVGKHLVYRLFKEEGLALKKRPQRKRKNVRHREERFIATAPNQAWSIDFVGDQLQDGTRFRALTILDVYTRESVTIEAMEEAVCWHGDGSGSADEAAPGREQPVEATGCRSEPG